MIFLDGNSLDASFWFGLEEYLSKETEEDYFLFWHTKPTLMLGKFQSPAVEIDYNYARSEGIDIVRRLSGGGTIYTDPGSWQFSFIRREQRKEIDFREFVEPILISLRALGFPAAMSGRNDLLLNGRKFCGNAQHYSHGRLIHHGSILFATDIEQMVRCLTVDHEKFLAKGIASVRQRVVNLQEHRPELTNEDFRAQLLEQVLGSTERRGIDPALAEKITRDYAPKFASQEWVFGKSPAFEFRNSKKFPGGRVEVALNIKRNRIADCELQGDFFLAGDLDEITERLVGTAYEPEAVRRVLAKVEQGFYLLSVDELLECFF